jgi:hypothetical protein
MAKLICPVAKCGKEIQINSHSQGYKHFQDEDEFHRQLHYNWLNYFFSDLAKSDYTDDLKFRIAYQRWHKQQKELAKKQKKGEKNLSGNFEVRNGKIIKDGMEYTQEEFMNMQKGIKYIPVEMKK